MRNTASLPALIIMVGMLAACVSGKPAPETATGLDGQILQISSPQADCERSCNRSNSICMESFEAQNSGANMPSGMTGASGECRAELKKCLKMCKLG